MIKFLTHPVYPMLAAAVLYGLIAFAFFRERPWFAGMWVCYAVAIVCLIMDTRP